VIGAADGSRIVGMNYPLVTERQVPMEAVGHDPFIDSLAAPATPAPPAPKPAPARRELVRRRRGRMRAQALARTR
jgi:hypothetical protein